MNKRLLYFKGGVSLDSKSCKALDGTINPALVPAIVEIPLSQHRGAPAIPVVNTGDFVRMGQKIGEANGFSSSNIHASVSGKVISIKDKFQNGVKASIIVIENDGKDELDRKIRGHNELKNLSPQEIISIIGEGGIIDTGREALPVHAKLNQSKGQAVNAVIINGVGYEPYLVSGCSLMVENSREVILGLKALLKSIGAVKGYIVIEEDNPKAVSSMADAGRGCPQIEIITLKAKYPKGGEIQLIKTVKEKISSVSGCIVFDVNTAVAISRLITKGIPFVERVITVSGEGVNEPQNLSVRIGTPFKTIIEQCGGLADGADKVIKGGPMTGTAQYSLDASVTKDTSGIIVLANGGKKAFETSPCIRCGRCVDVCPVGLLPLKLVNAIEAGDFDRALELGVTECIECGYCSYICPAKRHLMQNIQLGKEKVN